MEFGALKRYQNSQKWKKSIDTTFEDGYNP